MIIQTVGWPKGLVVFGGSGLIGRNLLERVRGQVPELIAVVRASPLMLEGVQVAPWHELDTLRVGSDTVVVHLAAQRYEASRFRDAQSEILTNDVTITGRIYEFCLRHGISDVRLASSS